MKKIHFFSKEESKNITSRMIYLRNNILHMTQSEFSSALNISQTYLSLIESGKKDVSMSTFESVLSVFKVSYDWLTGITDVSDNPFLSTPLSKEYFLNADRENVLSDMQKIYHLNSSDMDFLKWFLSLSARKRLSFISGAKELSSLMKDYPSGSSTIEE